MRSLVKDELHSRKQSDYIMPYHVFCGLFATVKAQFFMR